MYFRVLSIFTRHDRDVNAVLFLELEESQEKPVTRITTDVTLSLMKAAPIIKTLHKTGEM